MSELELKGEIEALKSEMSRLRRDVVDVTGAVQDAGKSGAGAIRAAFEAKTREPAQWIHEKLAAAKQEWQKALDKATSKVESRPIVSLLVSFGVGFLAGKALERR